MDAEELALKMCCCATIEEKGGAPPPWHCGHQLPYARALIEAEKALEALLDSPAEFEDPRVHYASRQVNCVDWTEAQRTIASLRSLLERARKEGV